MNKKTITIAAAVLIALGLGIYAGYFMNRGAGSYKDATYTIGENSVTLKDGVAETEAAPGSNTKTVTRYFGNEVKYDFDGDGREDIAFLLTQESGGSGTFFYAVAALNTKNGYIGSQAFFLGDRIAPQTTELRPGGVILVNYADRNPGEAFTVRPSLGKSVWLLLNKENMKFAQIEQNLEGTADVSNMNLAMKIWEWTGTIYNNNTEIKPRVEKKFMLTFRDKNTFSATTDCNNIGGEYIVNVNKISFSKIFSTKMFCEGSQEGDFLKALGEIQDFHFTPKGMLIFGLKSDSGSVLFK